MRIGLYGRALANRAGIGRYARELLRALAALDACPLILYAGKASQDGVPPGVRVVRLPGRSRLWEEQVALPRALRAHPVDVFHNPDFTLPLGFPRGIPSVITVHDVAYARLPSSNSLKSRILLRSLVPGSLHRADAIIAVSDFTRREIADVYGTDPAKIQVIPNGVEERFRPARESEIEAFRRRRRLPEERLVLHVGTIEERKNLVKLAEAVHRIPGASLVLAGGEGRAAAEILDRARAILGERLHRLGFVEDADLPALYGAASVFAYPSLYEGFGIPPVEAMACAVPVAVADAASLPEVTAGGAELFAPEDVADMADKLRRILDDPDYASALGERGRQVAARYRWPEVARRTLALYETLE